jgi:glycosyltransferase involved in cell wall biosynthesis
MKLTVLSVAYPFSPVGPATPGGAEQILGLLDAALVAAGHRSIVISCDGSTTRGTLVATPGPNGTIDPAARSALQERHRAAIRKALRKWRIDLVHMHGLDFHRYLPPAGVPVLVTLHLPFGSYEPGAFRLNRPGTYFHCVSGAQRRSWPDVPNLLPEIENGVPVDDLFTPARKRNFVVALGRICPEKGFHLALEAAKRAKVPILLAGQVFPYEEHGKYYRERILPRLDRHRKFIGAVGFRRKRRLLTAARCLLAPSEIAETSSLVAMEALACGTPVVAFPRGALAELIEDGRTGFLVNNEIEMAAAIHKCRNIDPETCRKAARERFDSGRMIDSYFAAYRHMRNGVRHG